MASTNGRMVEWVIDGEQLGADALQPNDSVYLRLTVQTGLRTGPTDVHLYYRHIPGYWDGSRACTIQKSPLVFHHAGSGLDYVGIGTNQPASRLAVTDGLTIYNNTTSSPTVAVVNKGAGAALYARQEGAGYTAQFEGGSGVVISGVAGEKNALSISGNTSAPTVAVVNNGTGVALVARQEGAGNAAWFVGPVDIEGDLDIHGKTISNYHGFPTADDIDIISDVKKAPYGRPSVANRTFYPVNVAQNPFPPYFVRDLLGDSASFGLPGPAPSFGADTEISLELEFSKSRKTLTLLSFDLELREKEWILLPAPVRLTLEGLSFHVDVYDPLGTNRMVMAQIAAQAAFGDDSNGGHALQLVCGGSYPSGDLYLQASNTIPVGALLEKMVGPSSALEKLTVEDLRLEYNYHRKHLALQFDVPESWTIVKGFDVGNLQFRIQGGESYSGGLAASLQIAGVHVYLAALYDQGWQFEGSTGPGQEIAIGELLSDLGKKFGVAADHPAALESLVFKNLHVAFNSATRDFTFKGEADFDIQDTPVAIEVAVDIAHDSNGLAQKRFSGVITFSTGDTTHEFDVVFADEKMMLADQGQVEVSTLLAAYRSTAGDPPSMRDLAPSGYKDLVPDIKTRGAFLAKQWKKTGAGESSKWLIGLSLEAGLDLSNVQLPNLPLMGSGGPPKSLKLDLQVLVPTTPFDEADVAIISRLNTSGGVNVPSHAVEAVAVATVLLLDGQTVTLNLPIKANPSPAEGQAAFGHDPSPPAIKTPAVAGAEQAVAVTPGVAVTADDTKWVKIQKNFGPIHIERVGLKYKEENKEEKLFIFLDGGLTAAGFTVSLQGLGVDTPLTKFDPHFHLSGIGLDYKGGGVKLGGAFLQQEMQDPDTGESYTAYAGQAVLKTEQLSLSAIGSFFKIPG